MCTIISGFAFINFQRPGQNERHREFHGELSFLREFREKVREKLNLELTKDIY